VQIIYTPQKIAKKNTNSYYSNICSNGRRAKMQDESITPISYFYQNTKLFLKFIKAHYKKDERMLEEIYLDTLELYQKYIDTYMTKTGRIQKLKEIIYELLDILSMREQNEDLKIKDIHLFKGIKIKEKIIGACYIELWVKGNKLWLYVFENNKNKEVIIPYNIEEPYLFDTEQTFFALKDKVRESMEIVPN